MEEEIGKLSIEMDSNIMIYLKKQYIQIENLAP